MNKNNRLIFIGAIPPPVHGMSWVNKVLLEHLKKEKNDLVIINSSPSFLEKFFESSIWKVTKAILFVLNFIKLFFYLITKKNTVYISLSGGNGLFFELGYVWLSQLFAQKILLHHHSFAYINENSHVMRFICKLAQKKGTHVLLSKTMANQFCSLYSLDKKSIFVQSNSVFMEQVEEPNNTLGVRTIGFLGNICTEKGIFRFLEIAGKLKSENIGFLIAGPIIEPKIESAFKELISSGKNIKYIGSVYGERKREFYQSLDLLLFPSNYINEAEPLTIYEALSFGIPVIAWERGSIGDMISSTTGLLVTSHKDFTEEAVFFIISLVKNADTHKRLSNSSFLEFLDKKKIASDSFNKLINSI
jgi:glycosyltransferase involved in cell wall biosynthesis